MTKKQDPDPDSFVRGTDPHTDPLVRGTDPRIQIRTKMSRIRNTGFGVQISAPPLFTKITAMKNAGNEIKKVKMKVELNNLVDN
jgi:hypothetical protein